MKNLILVTGSNGRFSKILRAKNKILDLKFLSKQEFNILNLNSMEKNVIKYKPDIIMHCAGLSRPMKQHYTNLKKSIDLNIIGTKCC